MTSMGPPTPIFCYLHPQSVTACKRQGLQNNFKSCPLEHCTSLYSFNWTLESRKHNSQSPQDYFNSKHLSLGPSLMPAISCICLTAMLQRRKGFAMNTNVPLTGTTPMSTTAACIMPTSTLVPLHLWSVSSYATLKHFTHCEI